jgi:hypothetical protein
MFWATACGAGLVSSIYAQNERLGSAVRHMDEAHSRTDIIAAGLTGYPSLNSPRRFNSSIAQSAPINNDPGLQGHIERKVAQTLRGSVDPADAVVNVGSHPSFVEFADFPSSRERADLAGHEYEQLVRQPYGKTVQYSRDDPRAFMTSPVDGFTLSAIQVFTWAAGLQPQDYWIWVGSCYHCSDLLDQDTQLQQSVAAYLPTDRRVIFATLFTESAGKWYWVDYQFVATNSLPQPARMISPVNGATLSASQSFTWTPGGYVDEYFLWVGSCQDCNDILNESENQKLSRTVSLPTDGRTIYISLFSSIAGQWYWYDYQYRAPYGQPYAPRISVTNNLDYPINVFVNGTAVGSVSALSTQYADVTVTSLTVSFQLVQPTLAGKALGDPMAGIFQTIASPSGEYSFTVGTVIGQQAYFEPLITNQTGSPVEIEVNAGVQAENRCYCDAPAGSTNVGTGYYMLYNNGNVRLFPGGSGYTGDYWFWGTDVDGKVATGDILPGYVDGLGRAYFTLRTSL